MEERKDRIPLSWQRAGRRRRYRLGRDGDSPGRTRARLESGWQARIKGSEICFHDRLA